MMTAGNAPDVTLEAFNELVHASAEDLTAIKDGRHMLWTGDGQDWEGFKSWIKRRREELEQPDEGDELCNVLIATLKLCDTKQALTQWLTDNGDTVEQLDGAASRKFQLAYDLQASNINLMDKVGA